jgi:hypothetical protein
MSIESILAQIDFEIARLSQVRTLLATTGQVAATKIIASKPKKPLAKAKTIKRRVLSPEARKRIADARHKRWAVQKAKSK